MKSDDKTIVAALRILAHVVECDDGVAVALILEAAARLEELSKIVGESKAAAGVAVGNEGGGE